MKIICVFVVLLVVIVCMIILKITKRFWNDMYEAFTQTKSIINETEENKKMNIYLVMYNGKISSEAYLTLKEAQNFCESRGAKQVVNHWFYQKDDDVYMITDVQVMKKTKKIANWIKSKNACEKYVCSSCGGSAWYYDVNGHVSKSDFCPNCGAYMKKEV